MTLMHGGVDRASDTRAHHLLVMPTLSMRACFARAPARGVPAIFRACGGNDVTYGWRRLGIARCLASDVQKEGW